MAVALEDGDDKEAKYEEPKEFTHLKELVVSADELARLRKSDKLLGKFSPQEILKKCDYDIDALDHLSEFIDPSVDNKER